MDTTADGTPDAAHQGQRGRQERRGQRGQRGQRDSEREDERGRDAADGASSRRAPGPYSGVGALDAAGIAVLACSAVWTLIAATGRAARPEGALLALLAVTAGFAAGRVLGAVLPVLAPAAAAVTVLVLVLVPSSRLSGGSHSPPLGYANADAALLVLAVGGACCAAWAARGPVVRTALWLTGAGAAATALALGSTAGFAAGLAVVVCSLAAARMRQRLLGLAGLALATLLAVGGSYALAENELPSGLSQSLTGQLTQPRVDLWHQAVTLAEHHPLRGVGPERFPDDGSAVPDDAPSPISAQSAPLQLAAEQGLPGAGLLGIAFGWLLCALWRSSRPTPVVLTAGAALTGLAMLASVDHVLGYAAVTAGAGFLAGIATARPLADDLAP
jgi:O-antigen ligase